MKDIAHSDLQRYPGPSPLNLPGDCATEFQDLNISHMQPYYDNRSFLAVRQEP